MAWQRWVHELGVMVLGAVALGAACDEVPPDAPSDPSAPLAQESVVPVEVDVPNVGWVTMPLPQKSAERLARHWCWYERMRTTDARLCGRPTVGSRDPQTDIGAETLADPTVGVCKAETCRLRNEICAGMLLEEVARSPIPRTLDSAQLGGGAFPFNGLLDLPDTIRRSALMAGGAPETLARTPRIRFRPMKAGGRAAALRGALNRYREAGVIAELLTSSSSRLPQPTCADRFAPDPAGNVETTSLVPGADGLRPTWADVLMLGVADAGNQYSGAIYRAVDAMRDSAQAGVRGANPELAEIGTQWNGSVDSAVAIANLLGFGELTPGVATSQLMALPSSCGDDLKASDIGPTGVPVCPPISEDEGAKRSVNWMRGLKHKPQNIAAAVSEIVNAQNAVWIAAGKILLPLPESQVLAKFDVTAENVLKGAAYQCANAQLTGTQMLPAGTVGSGAVTAPIYTGTSTPQGTLPPAAISAHFTGVVATAAQAVGSRAYSASGGIRAVDSMKKTTKKLLSHPMAAAVQPKLLEGAGDIVKGMEGDSGGRRIEFAIGSATAPPEGVAVDKLVVLIHGVPASTDNPNEAAEKYQLVQGVKGLKCALGGNIDGQTCDPADYVVDLNGVGTYSAAPDARMTDLSGGYLSAVLTAIPQPGQVSHPILVEQPVYLIRVLGGEATAFGGVVPAPGTLTIPSEPTWPPIIATRALITPAGGTLEQVLQNAVTPNSDDCSKTQTTCAGLPADIWPPLESEIVGEPSSQPFEQSWKHYLALAKEAAAEADNLGQEMLDQGLQMDLRAEEMQGRLDEACGSDLAGCGIGSDGKPEPAIWVTLGDKEACLWKLDDVICKGAGPGAPCPIVLAPNQTADAPTCTSLPGFPAGAEPIPARALGIVQTSSATTNPGYCAAFARLRTDSAALLDAPAGDGKTKKLKREEYIREFIINEFGRERMFEVAKGLRYEELFADNYRLTLNGAVIFDTTRQTPGASDLSLAAPCNLTDEDKASGSEFWTTQVICTAPFAGCPHDSCPNPTPADVSADTEPDQLRARWAWGFGHLRRAVATLGVITGQMNSDMMQVARVFPRRTVQSDGSTPFGEELRPNPTAGDNYALGKNGPPEPLWLFHGAPWNDSNNRQRAKCVQLAGVAGPGPGDPNRELSGRPVNFNGFIPNALPAFGDHKNFISPDVGSTRVIANFPVLRAANGTYFAGGLDPQMPYCNLPRVDEINALLAQSPQGFGVFSASPAPGATTLDNGREKTSGYIGTHFTGPVALRSYAGGWQKAVNEMWTNPGVDEAFCGDNSASANKAVWRALCHVPGADPPSLTASSEFTRFGRLPAPTKGAIVHADEAAVGKWVSPIPKGNKQKYGQMLLDLRKGDPTAEAVPFQYPLTQRNIFDALELACHAKARAQTSAAVNCAAAADVSNLPESLDAYAGALECRAKIVSQAAERFTVGPVPKSLLEAFGKNKPLPSTSGLGGEYLQSMSRQFQALSRAAEDFAKIRDASAQLALHMRSLKEIAVEQQGLTEAAAAKMLGSMLKAYITATQALGSIDPKNPATAGTATAVAAASFALAQTEMVQASAELKAQDAGLEQKRIAVMAGMISSTGAAREAASDFLLALNDLNQATADQKLVLKKAAKAAAGKGFADYAVTPDGKNDPQFVNVVMRRMFNTKLIRYEKAFERAKRLAYLARRAVELRFGVDLQRMDQPMTLLAEPPSKWANEICDLQGLNYAEIRQPNPEAPVTGTEPGAKPLPGDDFAHAYVGDYVKKLEDFVSSYSIDFPLKDGDDIAVVSLADDVFKVSESCQKPGANLLYYSTELDKSDTLEPPSATTQGWYTSGCGETLPPSGGEPPEEWRGCVAVQAETLEVAGQPGLGLTRDGLPKAAVPYRLRNEPCVPQPDAEGNPTVCPSTTQYFTRGALTQNLVGLDPGTHVASAYVLGGNGSVQSEMRIVRSDGTVVEAVTLVPGTSQWQRNSLQFVVESGQDYRLEIAPSKTAVALDSTNPSTWPDVFVAAAQVERAVLEIGASTAKPTTWVRTDLSRDVVDPVCTELRGPALRKRFQRKCEYVCADGIQTGCAAMDTNSAPTKCFYEANFAIRIEDIESGSLIPSGQIAIGNFNYRHNLAGLNAVGTGVTDCDGQVSSCYYNGFLEYSLIQSGNTVIRSYTGGSMPAKLDRGIIEHGKGLAAERTITNPPSSSDSALMEPYMKHEYKGRPLHGLYTLRIWERPGLRWDHLDDFQLVWKYHYWTRFPKEKP